MPRTSSTLDRYKRAETDLARLNKEYDAEKGGYNVTSPGGTIRGTPQPDITRFVESQYTPVQGGYYADSDRERAAFITGKLEGVVDPKTLSKTEERGLAPGGGFGDVRSGAASQVSARKPFKRVSRSLRKQRKSTRRQRALTAGRKSTILTGTLGDTRDDDLRKKTLLG